MKKLVCILSLVTLVALSLSAPTTSLAQQFKFRLSTLHFAGQKSYEESEVALPKYIKEATNGRIVVTLHPAGELAPASEFLNGVSSGMYEMAYTTLSYYARTNTFFNIGPGQPLTWRSPDDYFEVYERGLGAISKKVLATYGIYDLGPSAGDTVCVIAKKPLGSVSDFKGLKIRSYGPFNDLLLKLGAAPTSVPLAEIYTGLTTGVFDAVLTGAAGMYDAKLYEICKYGVSQMFLGMSSNELVMNMKAWNSLPQDLQASLQMAVKSWGEWQSRNQVRLNEAALKGLASHGTNFTPMKDAEWDKMVAEASNLWKKLAEGNPDAEAGVKVMIDYFKSVGVIK